jgi:flavin reductase (DIM6/NTAB) family NADH-FMN oxidoreductase RutF
VGRFPTGVAVVLGSRDGELVGLTVNSFTSVSLDPLLLLFCTRRESRSAARLQGCGRFTINILSAAQTGECLHFAGKRSADSEPEIERRDDLVWLKHANAAFVCETEASHAAGDHMIVVARVVELLGPEQSAPPLVFHEGAYARLAGSERNPTSADSERCAP